MTPMMKRSIRSVTPWPWAAAALALCAAPAAEATNGYFAHGYGVKALGQAGVGVAWAQDGLAAATNPAGTFDGGDRADLGLTWFAPRRSAEIVGNGAGADASYSGDGKKNFFIPELGVTRRLTPTLAAGVAVYGNGGMNTEYQSNPYARFGATGTAGVNLEQLFVSPSLAWQPVTGQRLGVALNVVRQSFSATGIGLFAGYSQQPAAVSVQGTDSSTGAGLRLGWTGTLLPGLDAGLTWSSKVHGRFDKYAGLFADGGRFDVPENYAAGLSWRPATGWTLGLDWQKIRYSQVGAVGNSVAALWSGTPLGASGGAGFGWRDVAVTKLAGAWQASPAVTLRAGYSHANQAIPAGETFFNILAPGTVQDHTTLGATWVLGGGELTGYYARGRGKTVYGAQSIPASFGGGNANVRLSETLLGLGYGWKF